MTIKALSAYQHLGLPQALSLANVFAVFALQMTGSALSSLIDYTERPAEFFAIRLGSLCVFAVVVWLGRITLDRLSKVRPLPLVTLVAIVFALALSTTVFDALLVIAGFTDQHVVWRRLLTSAPGVLVSQIMTSLLVTYAAALSQSNALLSQAKEQLVSMRADAKSRIAQRKTQLLASIRREIEGKLDGLRSSSSDSLVHVQALIDDVVRPLSYSLTYTVEQEPDVLRNGEVKEIDWRTVLRGSLFQNPFHWVAAPVLIAAMSASFLVTTFRSRGMLAVVAILLVFALFTFLANKLWPRLSPNVGVPARATVFVVHNFVLAWINLLLISEITGSLFVDTFRLPAWLILTNVATWTVALVSEVNTLLRKTNVNLKRSVSELKREVVALNSSFRQLQRGVAKVLHGPIQQAIHATLVRLEANPGMYESEVLAADLHSRISYALDSFDSPAENSENLIHVLQGLRALWCDTVDIRFSVGKHVEGVLRSHSAASLSVSELIQEATSNAIRHGNARIVHIVVEITDDQRSLAISVSNNGLPLTAEAKSGLGTQLFEDLAIEWSRTEKEGMVVVHARLPKPLK